LLILWPSFPWEQHKGIDGAYGAFFHLSPELRPLLTGLPRGDSRTLDPHKGMFLPYGTGALLVHYWCITGALLVH